MSGDMRERLAEALYRLEWDASLYATPRNHVTERYERRADRLMQSAPWSEARAEGATEVRERVEAYFADMGRVWGGDEMWLTSGNKVAQLVQENLRAALDGTP